MKPIRFLLAALAVIGLSACYTSDKPLIADDDAVTPFQKITFYNDEGKPLAYTIDGKRYKTTGDDGDSYLHLKSVEGDYYVAQISGPKSKSEPDTLQILYGYLRIDPAAKVADMWKMVGTKEDVRPGLRECEGGICIDDLDAYIAYAKEGIAAGAKPDATMKIDVE